MLEQQNFETASDIAYRIISQKILDGSYPPGMKLSRRNMAEATGVSVIPVIEALKRLEEDRLVESKPKWGSFVAVPTIEKIRQSYQLREAIECQAARYLAMNMTDDQKEKLWELATELDTVVHEGRGAFNTSNTHIEFHAKLVEYTDNPLMVDALRRINMFWILCTAIDTRAPQCEYPRYWHRLLMDKISSGDMQVAEDAMREHVYDSLKAIENSQTI